MICLYSWTPTAHDLQYIWPIHACTSQLPYRHSIMKAKRSLKPSISLHQVFKSSAPNPLPSLHLVHLQLQQVHQSPSSHHGTVELSHQQVFAVEHRKPERAPALPMRMHSIKGLNHGESKLSMQCEYTRACVQAILLPFQKFEPGAVCCCVRKTALAVCLLGGQRGPFLSWTDTSRGKHQYLLKSSRPQCECGTGKKIQQLAQAFTAPRAPRLYWPTVPYPCFCFRTSDGLSKGGESRNS